MIRYGLEWGEDISDVTIELKCYRYPEWVKKLGGTPQDPYDHFVRAVRMLFVDPYTTDPPLVWNRWTEEHAYIWTHEHFATIWGPAAASKSNDFGCFSIVDWWAAPKETCIFVCSTTKSMLEKRIWDSVKKYFGVHASRAPGKLSKARCAIINDDEKDTDNVKAGIHGIAVLQGSVEEAKANIIGVHLPYIVLVIDELQQTRRAAIEARANLSKGCKQIKVFGLANPGSLLDLSGEFSEPIDGWDSVDIKTHVWKTRWGKTYHYDGYDSPAVTEENGAEKYPFLINQKQIDDQIRESGDEDHPDVWTYVRGFPSMQSEYDHILSEKAIVKFKMKAMVKWQYDYITIAGLDPAFSSGGDKCFLTIAKLGIDIHDHTIIQFSQSINIPIKASSEDEPVYQVAREVIRLSEVHGFLLKHLTVDETASQSVGAVIDAEANLKGSNKCHKIVFSSKATEIPVSVDNDRQACDEYKDKVTEIWYAMREFGRYEQIKGMSFDAAKEFCMRKVQPGKPARLESKDDMKERLHHSPDIADSYVCVLAQVREIIRLIPGEHREELTLESVGASGGLTRDTKNTLEKELSEGYADDSPQEEFRETGYEEW